MAKFPEVQGGGSLILAWQVRNKNVLVIGGGEVRKIDTKHFSKETDTCSRSRLVVYLMS